MKANVHAGDDYSLRLSAKNGHIKVVLALLIHGANVHGDNNYALRWSVHNNYPKIVKILLLCGASMHCCDDKILKKVKYLNNNLVAAILPYCDAKDYHYFSDACIVANVVPTKNATSVNVINKCAK